MIYCENIVNVTVFFLLLPRFRNHFFFPPIFGNVIATIVTIFFPYFSNGIATISLPQFFFFFHSGHSTHTSYPGNRNWAKEFRYSYYRNSTFSFSPFFFFFLILFVEFRQWWYRDLLSFLTILNNFQQFL